MDQRKNLINRSRTNRNPSSKEAEYQESGSRGYNGSSTQQALNRGSHLQSKIQEIASLCREDKEETEYGFKKISQAQYKIQNAIK